MELTLKFSTNETTRCRKCKNELPAEYSKKTCDACLAREKQRDIARRQKRKFEEMENVVPGDLPAKIARKELQITKVSHRSSIREKRLNKNPPKAPDVEFKSKEELLQQLRLAFEVPSGRVIFRAFTLTAIDPLADTKEVTRMIGKEIWRVSGYRFR